MITKSAKFPEAPLRRTVIKVRIEATYSVADLEEYEAVKESVETALAELQCYGSAEAVYESKSRKDRS